MTEKQYSEMSSEELTKSLMELRLEQLNFRMRRAMGDSPRPHLFKLIRRNIARIKTQLTRIRQAGE